MYPSADENSSPTWLRSNLDNSLLLKVAVSASILLGPIPIVDQPALMAKEEHSTCSFHNLRIAQSDLQIQLRIGEAHPVCVELLPAQGKSDHECDNCIED